ncbi:MAG: bifunctional DNA primase/polymerase [Terracidiphilus sp.]
MTGGLAYSALEYAARGWLVIPLHSPTACGCSCRRAECESPGKHPRTAHGLKDASRDPAMIREWWNHWPDANIGIVTGPESGIFVLDVDGKRGEESLIELERRYSSLPDTYTVRTGGGGLHLYFLWPEGADVRNSQSRIAPGLDIRGEGGYVVVPQSLHASGTRYEVNESAILPAPCPEWLLSLSREPQGAPAAGATASQLVGKGARTNRLVSLAGSMHKRGMTPEAIEAALLKENARFAPPLPEEKVRAIAHDIPARYPNPADEGQTNGFRLERLGDLLAKPEVSPDYLVDGLLVRGTVSALVAKPKVGKSTLARLLCLAVATGKEFLGRSTGQGACIYLALEERKEEITADFRAMGADGTEAIDIHADTAPAGAISALVGLVRNQRPALVVIDPLFRLAHIRDEKAYAEVYAALGPLIDTARETGTHILVTHHSGKAQKADAIDRPLGSTALGGAVSTLIVLTRSDSYRSVQTVQRIGADMPETVLSFDSATRRLSISGTRAEADRQAVEREIVEYLKGAGERGEPEIVAHVEGANAVKRKALRSLVERRQVERAGTGKRGNPFKYSFACTEPIPRTSVQESKNCAHTRMNTGGMLVRGNAESDEAKMRVQGLLNTECGGLLQ